MLKYYSYYNVGGYIDMYLGDSSMSEKKTYYLPLMARWQARAEQGDRDAAKRVDKFKNLPSIKTISETESYGLPAEANRLISRGGYKTILTRMPGGEWCFALRDIASGERDTMGRDIPFVIVIVGTSEADKQTLVKVALFASANIPEFSLKIADLIGYIPTKEGVEFNLAGMNDLIDRIASQPVSTLLTTKGVIEVDETKEVPLMVIPDGFDEKTAIKELALNGRKVKIVRSGDIMPDDSKLPEKRTRRARVVKIVSLVVAGLLLLGLLTGYWLMR